MNTRLSVVIPTRDTCELTLGCLRSLEAASIEETEVVVVDDGSVDDTRSQVQRFFPAVRILALARSRGFTCAANLGLRESKGELLLLLNSDTEVAADAPRHLTEALAGNPELGACGPQLFFPNGRPQWSSGSEPTLLWFFVLATGLAVLLQRVPAYRRVRTSNAPAATSVDWLRGTAMAIRKVAWLEAGPFDERFAFYCQDLDFCMSLRAAGWQVALVPLAKVVHHQGATIARSRGTVESPPATERYHPELLWTDFVRLTEKRYGEERARRVAWLLQRGGHFRILARRLAGLLLAKEKRDLWERDTASFRQATRALSVW